MNLYKTFSDVNCGEGVACLFFVFFCTLELGRGLPVIYLSDRQQRNLFNLKRDVNMSHEI